MTMINSKIAELFQSTHSLRSATHRPALSAAARAAISIHALLAECDYFVRSDGSVNEDISIHALLAECDRGNAVRGAKERDFNPRTPCGVRQSKVEDH